MSLFAGVDVGTGGARCLILDERGARVAVAERSWRYHVDELGLAALDPDLALEAVTAALAEAVAGCDADDIAAIGVCSQRSGVALLDADGRTIHLGPNADGRAILQGVEQQRAHGERIYRVNGRLPTMLYLPARLAWLREHRPDDAARVARALSLADWVVHALTGAAATERTQAAESMLYDLAADDYSDELLDVLAVPRALLPDIAPVGRAAGTVRAGIAGVPAGIPVVPGGADTQAAALGMGMIETGQAIVVAGNTMIAQRVTDDPVPDHTGRLWCSPHLRAGRWVREAHCGEAGAAIAWVADLLGLGADALAREAEAGVPGGGGVAFIDPRPSDVGNFPLVRRGALSFPAPLLALGRSRADVTRAVLEGIAFGARAGLEWLDVSGPVALAGGVSRSPVVAAALAGALDAPVRVATEAGSSARGAAIVAATEHHGGVDAAAEVMRDAGREVPPRADDGYAAHYAIWREQAALEAGTMRLGDLM